MLESFSPFAPLAGVRSLSRSEAEADVCLMPLLLDRPALLDRLGPLPGAGVYTPIPPAQPEPLLDEGILPLPEVGIRPSPPEGVVGVLPPKGDIPLEPADDDPPLRLEAALPPIPLDDPLPRLEAELPPIP